MLSGLAVGDPPTSRTVSCFLNRSGAHSVFPGESNLFCAPRPRRRVFCLRPQAPGAGHPARLARRISGGAWSRAVTPAASCERRPPSQCPPETTANACWRSSAAQPPQARPGARSAEGARKSHPGWGADNKESLQDTQKRGRSEHAAPAL